MDNVKFDYHRWGRLVFMHKYQKPNRIGIIWTKDEEERCWEAEHIFWKFYWVTSFRERRRVESNSQASKSSSSRDTVEGKVPQWSS